MITLNDRMIAKVLAEAPIAADLQASIDALPFDFVVWNGAHLWKDLAYRPNEETRKILMDRSGIEYFSNTVVLDEIVPSDSSFVIALHVVRRIASCWRRRGRPSALICLVIDDAESGYKIKAFVERKGEDVIDRERLDDFAQGLAVFRVERRANIR